MLSIRRRALGYQGKHKQAGHEGETPRGKYTSGFESHALFNKSSPQYGRVGKHSINTAVEDSDHEWGNGKMDYTHGSSAGNPLCRCGQNHRDGTPPNANHVLRQAFWFDEAFKSIMDPCAYALWNELGKKSVLTCNFFPLLLVSWKGCKQEVIILGQEANLCLRGSVNMNVFFRVLCRWVSNEEVKPPWPLLSCVLWQIGSGFYPEDYSVLLTANASCLS